MNEKEKEKLRKFLDEKLGDPSTWSRMFAKNDADLSDGPFACGPSTPEQWDEIMRDLKESGLEDLQEIEEETLKRKKKKNG
jgi:hypothetical protein